MPVPDFSPGEVLTASAMDSIGLWLVKTQTVGTGVSSVTVTGAFSADYDNYLITYTGGSQSVETTITTKLGSATTGYYGSLIYSSYASATVIGVADNNVGQWNYTGGGVGSSAYIELLAPFTATNTEIRARVRYGTVYGTFVGHRGDTVSYTSFILAPGSGTFTGGVIRVYGYRK